MDVSIVIRTKNEAEFIGVTLRKVDEQEFTGNFEIIIVDSGSTDSTLDIVKRYDVRLIEIPEKEFSYGRALNIGAYYAAGNYIVNLSAHALPRDKEWLTNLINPFVDLRVAGVYGRQLSVGRLNPFEALLNELFFGENKIEFNSRRDIKFRKLHFTNSNAAIRKNVWEKFKFNERVPYGEDIFWPREVIDASFSIVYSPDAIVYHTHKVSISSVYRNSLNCAYNLSLLGQKKRWMPLIMVDVALFFGLIPGTILRNLTYIWQHGYQQHARVAPFWVLSELLGSLMGKAVYRAKRRLW